MLRCFGLLAISGIAFTSVFPWLSWPALGVILGGAAPHERGGVFRGLSVALLALGFVLQAFVVCAWSAFVVLVVAAFSAQQQESASHNRAIIHGHTEGGKRPSLRPAAQCRARR
jgi:hypothetical protein